MHLGNLMGAVLPFAAAAKGNDAAIFVADLHTINSVKNGKTLREQTLEIAIEYLAILGADTPVHIFVESDIVSLAKLSLILSNVTPYALMLRAHAFKDSEAKWSEINMGTFNYPILMTADILGYDIDAVPVGRDQLQHLEMSRDIARAFNNTYGQEVFREPEAMIVESLATLPGIDGRKMSKSYDNFIGIFDDEKTLKKRVMSIVSGSEWVDERKKNPDECNIFNLYRVFATPEQTAELRIKYESENIGFGYGHAKTELLSVLTEYLRPYRVTREKLLQDIPFVEAKLREWAAIMNARLEEKMRVVKEVVGVN
jgi:tryptophanyl-tRNA synthetase